MTPKHAFKCIAFPLLAVVSGLAQASPSSGWDWSIAPYLWLISVRTDVKTTTPPVSASNDSQFDDVIDKLDGAFQVHAEGEGDDFGMFADITYLGLAAGEDRRFLHTESDLDARLFEIAAVWSPGVDRGLGGQVFAGVRVIDLDYTTVFIPTNPAFARASVHIDNTFTDFLVGGRYTWSLSDRWALTVRGDGSFGDTDGAFNASAVAQYRMRNGAWLFGYRYLDVDFKNQGDTLGLTLYGPEVGYAFRF